MALKLPEWAVIGAGMAAPHGVVTIGKARTGKATTTINSSTTAIGFTTASLVWDLAGGPPTMATIMAMVDVRGCGAKLLLPEAPIGGTGITPA